MTTSLHRRNPFLTLLVALVLALGVGTSTAASAQEPPAPGDDAPTATTEPESPADPSSDIIPEPNSGREPTEAGDRGGALQLGLLGLIVAALGGIVFKIVHDARRARSSL